MNKYSTNTKWENLASYCRALPGRILDRATSGWSNSKQRYGVLLNTLIFLAHGSRRQQSNDEVEALAEKIGPLVSNRFDKVKAAFLEISSPSLPEAIDHAIKSGAVTISIYPYFLNSGRHVEKDIPEIIASFRNSSPECEFVVMQHFGKSEAIVSMVVDQILSPWQRAKQNNNTCHLLLRKEMVSCSSFQVRAANNWQWLACRKSQPFSLRLCCNLCWYWCRKWTAHLDCQPWTRFRRYQCRCL